MNPDDQPLTKEETDLLPFYFLNAYYAAPDSTNTSYYFARWHGRLAYSIDLNRGWCYKEDNSDITLDHWEDHYPGFRYLNDRQVAPYLRGTHNGRSVCWSRSQNHWEYLNHRPVNFSHEEEQVTELLQSATLSTSRALSSLTPVPCSTPDPESRTQSIPGELPKSPNCYVPACSRFKHKAVKSSCAFKRTQIQVICVFWICFWIWICFSVSLSIGGLLV